MDNLWHLESHHTFGQTGATKETHSITVSNAYKRRFENHATTTPLLDVFFFSAARCATQKNGETRTMEGPVGGAAGHVEGVGAANWQMIQGLSLA